MLNISYSAAYDPYHTFFRFLTILSNFPHRSVEFEWLRIVDFYYCFPEKLTEFRAPRDVKGMGSRIRQYIKSFPSAEYASLPDSDTIYRRMEIIQDTALSALCRKEIAVLISIDGRRLVRLVPDKVPPELWVSVLESAKNNNRLLEILTSDFSRIGLLGPGGLKDRSGLEEYRYDTV